MVYRMYFLGGNFSSSLICTQKSKKNLKKPKNFFYKNLGFFQPWPIGHLNVVDRCRVTGLVIVVKDLS